VKIKDILHETSQTLINFGIPDANLEAEVLIRYVLKIDRETIFQDLEKHLSKDQEYAICSVIEKRRSYYPLSYIIGKREFYGIELMVNENVLIPRQETELLVDQVINVSNNHILKIVDVGTGSGAIAIAIATMLPEVKIIATDISIDALRVADENIKINGVSNRVSLRKSNLLDLINEKVDVIVSNPPYIPTNEIPNLQLEVQKEPYIALDGGHDGIDYIRKLISDAGSKLNKNGHIFIEIDPSQAKEVLKIAYEYFPNAQSEIIKDLSKNDRVLAIHT
jgi:release factor glutamine methyltransferase